MRAHLLSGGVRADAGTNENMVLSAGFAMSCFGDPGYSGFNPLLLSRRTVERGETAGKEPLWPAGRAVQGSIMKAIARQGHGIGPSTDLLNYNLI
jgi:hypothetical protein